MTYEKNIKIIAFVGLAGSGKTTAVDYMTTKGYPKVYFGGVLLAAMDNAGVEKTWANQDIFRVDIRAREGKDFVVRRILTQVHELIQAGQHKIIADGLYSWDEYKIMKQEFPGSLHLIAIVAPKHVRHHRLTIRANRPLTDMEANSRDWHEIEDIQKGGPIAIADHFIINDADEETLYAHIEQELERIRFYE